MTLKKIKKIVQCGENEYIEFKKSTSLLNSAFETVCAFLNGQGGTLLIGVTNGGGVLGQDISDHTKQEIANNITKIEPPAQPLLEIKYLSLDNRKQVIVITVKPGKHIPYVYDGRPFYRNQSTTCRMQQHRYEQLIVERGQLNHNWDEWIASKYNINSLDHEEIRSTVLAGINHNRIANEVINYSIEQILNYLELLDDGRLINAAVALYAKKMIPLYSHCELRMVRYRGNDKLADFVDSHHVIGNAFKLLLEADYFMMRHLPVASFFETEKGVRRIDKPALPVMAIREALINSICHRDYRANNSSIALAIFDDRMEIWNNGILPPQLHINDLKKRHDSFPRNKRIAAVFRASGWVEKAGVGTTRMIAECKAIGIPEPKFEEYSGGLAVVFKFKEPIGVSIKKPEVKLELSFRQKAILEIMKKYMVVNIQQIIKELDNSPTQRTIQKDLLSLKNKGIIHSEGKGKATMWLISA